MNTAKVIRLAPRKLLQRGHGEGYIKPRRGKLYLGFPYLGERIEKSTGIDDTPGGRAKATEILDRFVSAIQSGKFEFAKAFPRASEEEKQKFARLEGRDVSRNPEDVSFGDYLKTWVRENLDPEPSATKRRDYHGVIDHHLIPAFGDLTFQELDGVKIVQFVKRLRAQGLKTSRIRNILTPLRVIWRYARVQHRWDKLWNPFEFLEIENHGGRVIPNRKKNPPDPFRFKEWKQLLAAIDDWYRPICELMVHTGMISSELSRLTVEHAREQRLRVLGTKTEYRSREVPVTAPLRAVLDTLSGRSKSGFLVVDPEGAPLDLHQDFRKWSGPWAQAFKTAGLAYRRPYSTRHTFAIWHLVAGTNPEKLVRLMGHGSKQMVYETYGRYVDGLEENADAIRVYLGLPLA